MAEQEELTPSLITFSRKIRAETSPKGKQPKHEEKIHRITIVECPTCGKMVEKDDDHYCPPMRETDPSILVDTPWWEIKEDTASTANESWWDAYVQMLNEEPPRAPSPSLSEYIRRHEQAWKQGYEDESNIWGYNSYYTEPLKEDPTYNNYAWESMEDNWDEESSQHYKESRQPDESNHPEMRRRITRVINWRRFRAERLDRRLSTDRSHPKPWNITHESQKKTVKFQEGAWN